MGILSKVKWAIAGAMVKSSWLHLRLEPAPTLQAVVDLFDRFLDGTYRYDLEWDDFISWEYDDPEIETIRTRLGAFEPLLFSKLPVEKALYRRHVLEERDRLAHSLGMPLRPGVQVEP